MIKKHTNEYGVEFATCDFCGEGIGTDTEDEKAMDKFIEIHENCEKNDNGKFKNEKLQFLID